MSSRENACSAAPHIQTQDEPACQPLPRPVAIPEQILYGEQEGCPGLVGQIVGELVTD